MSVGFVRGGGDALTFRVDTLFLLEGELGYEAMSKEERTTEAVPAISVALV